MESSRLGWLQDLPPQAQSALLTEVRRALAEDQLGDYNPYAKQRAFHEAGRTHRERLLRAGNQNGKTFPCAREWAFHLTGLYPSWWAGRRWDRPIIAWAASETGEATRDNPQRALLGLPGETGTGAIPKRLLGGYGLATGIADLYDYIKVRHASGGWSLLRFKYYAQGRQKWQGPPVDAVWFDEEPPEDIYDEGLARTIATGGMAALTFTPLLGMSNVVKRFLMDKGGDRHDTNMTIEDAEHIPAAERARIIASFPAHEREARAKGIPTLGSGRIFPVAEETLRWASAPMPEHWARIAGLDFGFDHPTAAAFCSWDREADTFYVYDAYRRAQQTPTIHAAAIKARGDWIPVAWPADGLQTEKGTGIQLADQYRNQGLKMLTEHATLPETATVRETPLSRVSVEAGISEMLIYMEQGRFKVAEHLNDWWEEFRLYHRKDGRIVTECDDLLSATRYAFVMRRFAITRPGPSKPMNRNRPARDWRA